MAIQSVLGGQGYTVTVIPERRDFDGVNGSPPVGKLGRIRGTLRGTTDANGQVVFNLTTDGTGGGAALFSSLDSLEAIARRASATPTEVPQASIQAVSGDFKQVTVQAVTGRDLVALGATQANAPAGLTVYLYVVGSPA